MVARIAARYSSAQWKEPAALVSWVSDIEQLAGANPGRAQAVQLAVREQLQKCFAEKLVITGFARSEHENRYLLDSDIEAEVSAGDFEWRRKNASNYLMHED